MSKQKVLTAEFNRDSPTCCGVEELGGLFVHDQASLEDEIFWDEPVVLSKKRNEEFGELAYTIKQMTDVNKKLKTLGFKKLHSFRSNTTGNQVYMWFRNPKRYRRKA